MAREFTLVALGVALYFGVRGLTVGDRNSAVEHAHALVGWESGHRVYLEPSIQAHAESHRWITSVMNWTYVWGHWPVITLTLIWLVLRHPDGYRVTRNAMALSGLVGLLVFALYPVAPPRLAGLGLTDTVTQFSNAYRVLQPPAFVNQYAAMPSLHVGWDLLMGVALVRHCRHRLVRLIGMVLPAMMACAVVITANHYLLDVVVGVALVVVALWCAVLLERRTAVPGGDAAATAPGRTPVVTGGLARVPRQRFGPGARFPQ